MPFSNEQLQRFQNWMQQRGLQLRCPCCGGQNFTVQDLIVSPTLQGTNVDITKVVPMVPATCQNCSHILLFNAAISGVMPMPTDDSPLPNQS